MVTASEVAEQGSILKKLMAEKHSKKEAITLTRSTLQSFVENVHVMQVLVSFLSRKQKFALR